MIGPSALLKPVTALVAVGLLVVFLTEGEDTVPARTRLVQPRLRVDATSDAEARQMRHITQRLASELRAAARACDPARPVREFEPCVSPALQHAGVGGRGASLILGHVAAAVPHGRCLTYLLGLQAANSAAGDNARWLFGNIYDYRTRSGRRALVGQLALAERMLRRAARAGPLNVCSPGSGQPAI